MPEARCRLAGGPSTLDEDNHNRGFIMRLLHLKTLTLSVAIAASSSAVLAASLEGGAVAAPDRYLSLIHI